MTRGISINPETVSASATKARHGRKPIGEEPLARVTVTVSPSMLDAVDLLVAGGAGKRATILRGLLMDGLTGAGLDALVDAPGVGVKGDPKAEGGGGDKASAQRRPGPGSKRIGREPLVHVSVLANQEAIASIEDAARRTGLPRADVMRRLIESGYREVLLRGYRPAERG